MKGNPELNATVNRNIAIPDEVLASTAGKRGVVETQTAESQQSRMRNTERLSREDVKRKLLEFFEERMEKGKKGWKKKELSGLINVQDKLFQDVLSEIAHFKVVKIEVKTKDGKVVEKTERLWVLKEEMYTRRAGRILYKFLNSEIVSFMHISLLLHVSSNFSKFCPLSPAARQT